MFVKTFINFSLKKPTGLALVIWARIIITATMKNHIVLKSFGNGSKENPFSKGFSLVAPKARNLRSKGAKGCGENKSFPHICFSQQG